MEERPNHNKLMLSTKFRAFGIGRAFNADESRYTYWTVDFGGVVDASKTCNIPSCNSSGYVCYDWDKRAKASCSNGRCRCVASTMSSAICRNASGTAFVTACCQSAKGTCLSTASKYVKNGTIPTRYAGSALNGMTCG